MEHLFAAVCRAARHAGVADCQPLLDRWFAAAAWIAAAGLALVLLEWIMRGRRIGRAVRALGQLLLVVGVAGAFGMQAGPPPAAGEANAAALAYAQALANDAMQKIAITQLMDENLRLQASLEREKERRQGRALLQDQFAAIQAVKGKLAAASIIAPNNPEAVDFANDVVLALIAAGVDARLRMPPPGFTAAGITIWSAKPDDPLMDAFTRARLVPSWKNLATLPFPAIPHDIPLIAIGNRPLDAPAQK